MFKVGDKVMCIDDDGIKGVLTKGKCYSVMSLGDKSALNRHVEILADDGETIFAFIDRFLFSNIFENFLSRERVTSVNGISAPIPAVVPRHNCSCVFRDLLMQGCKCGGV